MCTQFITGAFFCCISVNTLYMLYIFNICCSLSERTRSVGVIDSWKFIYGHQDSSDFQVLGGDFNAEPLEPSMQYLVSPSVYTNESLVEVEVNMADGDVLLETKSKKTCNSKLSDLMRSLELHNGLLDHHSSYPCPDFIDAWIASNPMGINYSSAVRQSDDNQHLGYTFPACNPVKRIDYLFARNTTRAATDMPAWTGSVVDTRVVGIDPTAESGLFVYLCVFCKACFWLN